MKRFERSGRTQPVRRPRGPPLAPPQAYEIEALIGDVGARGHGVAPGASGPIYAPFTLPGERARLRMIGDRAELVELLSVSAERVGPPCAVFGRCGGCQLQHWAEAPYLAWKRGLVVAALARRGLETEVAPIVPAWGAGRRRAGFHAAQQSGAFRFGFMERGGQTVQPIEACPALAPQLEAALPALRLLGRLLAPSKGEAVLQCFASEAGIDVAVKGAGAAERLSRGESERLAQAVEAADVARLSLDGAPFITRRTPRLRMGLASVTPPPGAFLQPTTLGEETLSELVLSALAGASRVADLFCGVGTFALRLAQRAEVLAVEGEAAMLEALKGAADGAGGVLRQVTPLRRDLLRTPLAALELKRIEAVTFDPPRSGAKLQAEQIAASKVERVAAVSCDAATFARDARVLVDGGFRLERVTPVDQFRWSPHLEVVGVFGR